MKTPEQWAESVQVNIEDTKTTSLTSLNRFEHCSGVSIDDFEQVNAGWDLWWKVHLFESSYYKLKLIKVATR